MKCTHCGFNNEEDAVFCANCGNKLNSQKKEQPKDNNTNSEPNMKLNGEEDKRSPISTKKKKGNRKKLLVFFTLAVLAVLLLGGYFYGQEYYSLENQTERYIETLNSGDDAAIAQTLGSEDPNFEITEENIAPFVDYINNNKSQMKDLSSQLINSVDQENSNSNIYLKENGNKFLVFDNYDLMMNSVYPEIANNQTGTEISLNEENILSVSEDSKSTEIGPLAPGEYIFNVYSENNGSPLESDIDITLSGDDDGNRLYLNQEQSSQTTSNNPNSSNQSEAENQQSDEKNTEFENFKGIYVLFDEEPYKSSVEAVVIISNDVYLSGIFPGDYAKGNIVDTQMDNEQLTLNVQYSEQKESEGANTEFNFTLHDDQTYNKILQAPETGEELYPITTEDLSEIGFNVSSIEDILPELSEYDSQVQENIETTNAELLDDYSNEEIEYARVWLTVMNNPQVKEVTVNRYNEGSPIHSGNENSAVYPREVVQLTGFYGSDGAVTYASNGDGTIEVYDVPTHWHMESSELPEVYDRILNNTETIYVDPGTETEVVQMINKLNIK